MAHATVVEQARLVSSAEMFRLFAVDVRNLGSDGEARLSAPDAMPIFPATSSIG